MSGPTRRPRRLRADGIRNLVGETTVTSADLIAPIFVDATISEPVAIPSMPDQYRWPITGVVEHVQQLVNSGIATIMLFGIPETKDEIGTRAWASDGIIQRAVATLTDETDATIVTDVCLCEYTDHGHCGVLEESAGLPRTLTVDNDETLKLLGRIATSHADAGADMVAPSGMMDGMVGAIRQSLDSNGFHSTAIMSYAVKYESAFYGPFRDAADGAPAFGDRRHYQMDPRNSREGIVEAELDIQQGTDIVMVKPALGYLDVLYSLRTRMDVPLAAYCVSGEYAMLHAAADRGWIDLDQAVEEVLTSIKRAGADMIVTYFAESFANR